uniref:C-type lectin domain-containing protein n=1 Tax=Acrobeloides nanus TaxID=290746 RepID=A0A914DC92_9BILA
MNFQLVAIFTLAILCFDGAQAQSCAQSLCPQGWSCYDNKCWSVQDTNLDWNSAEKACVGLGGHLASVENAFEDAFLNNLITETANHCQYYWLGGYANGPNGYSWTDGNAFNYTNWGQNEPNKANTCVGLRTTYFHWHMFNCDYPDCSICMKKAGTFNNFAKIEK